MGSQLTIDDVSAEPLPTTATGSEPSQQVIRTDNNIMELKPLPKRMEKLTYAIMLVGVASSLAMWGLTKEPMFAIITAVCIFVGALSILSICIIIRSFGTHVQFVRNDGIIIITGSISRPSMILDIENVIGIQLLYIGKTTVGYSSLKIDVYQFNFILKSNPIERIQLLECGKHNLMQELAIASADFLNIPLFEQNSLMLWKEQPNDRG